MSESENHIKSASKKEFELAEKEFSNGNLQQSLVHIAIALSYDPENAEYLKLVDDIVAASGDPQSLLDLEIDDEAHFVAVKALILAKIGKFDDALNILLQIALVRPDIRYLKWVLDWEKAENFYKKVTADKICTYITDSVLNLPDISFENYIIRDLWDDILSIVGNARTVYPDDEYLAFVHAISARRALKFDEAVKIAQNSYDKKPCFMTSLALANAYRDIGKTNKALEHFSKCLDYRENDIDVRLDMADMLCQEGRESEGIRLYNEVLEDDPENSWALTSLYYFKYMSTDNPVWRNKLERFALANPENERAANLVDAITPYVGYLPEMQEATIGAMIDIAEKFEHEPDDNFGGKININLMYPECPSSRLSAEILLTMKNLDIPLIFSVQNIPNPDPREPRGNPEHRIWVYKDGQPKAVVEPPKSEATRQIAGIAITGFNIHHWRDIANAVAEELGAESLKSLLGIMAHTPRPHLDFEPWDWLFRIQLASALVIAYLDEGWENSLRKQVLLSLLYGPADWTVTAAIVALTEIALDIPEIRGEIVDEFAKLLEKRPDGGFWCLEYPLVTSILRIPGLDDTTREFFEKYRSDLEN